MCCKVWRRKSHLSDALSSDNLQSNIIPCHRRLLSVSGEQINTQLLNATADRSQAWTGNSAHTACVVKLLSMNTALYYTILICPGAKIVLLLLEEGISYAKEVSFGSLASKWPSSHPHDLIHMANLNCMFDQVFFSGLGVEVNIQFIIRSMHHTVYILTSLVNFVPKTSKKLAFSIKFALFLSPSFLCSFSCALPLSYVFLSKDLSRKQVEKAKRACRLHMTHTLQCCDKE